MVTSQDAKIESAVEKEEIAELRELREAQVLMDGVLANGKNYNDRLFQEHVSMLDKVARLLLDAKTRNNKISAFSMRLEKDFLSFRGGGKKRKVSNN